jgi:hypothetical protein
VISLKEETVVGRDVAEAEFERMCRAFRVETEVEAMDAVSAAQFKYRQGQLVKAIMFGALQVDEDGMPALAVEKIVEGAFVPVTLKFRRPTGATFIAMEQGSGQHAQMALAATNLTESNKGIISTLTGPDFRRVEYLTALFLDM